MSRVGNKGSAGHCKHVHVRIAAAHKASQRGAYFRKSRP